MKTERERSRRQLLQGTVAMGAAWFAAGARSPMSKAEKKGKDAERNGDGKGSLFE